MNGSKSPPAKNSLPSPVSMIYFRANLWQFHIVSKLAFFSALLHREDIDVIFQVYTSKVRFGGDLLNMHNMKRLFITAPIRYDISAGNKMDRKIIAWSDSKHGVGFANQCFTQWINLKWTKLSIYILNYIHW